MADQVTRAVFLPPSRRRAVGHELAYFEGRTYREVTVLLGPTREGTIKSRIRNGLRRMRAALNDAGMETVEP